MIFIHGASVPITRYTRVIPQPDALKIINKLFNGQYHIQTIGTPALTLSVELQVDTTGKNALDTLNATAGMVTVISEGVTYHGVVLDVGQWSKPIRGQYRSTVTVAVGGA